MPFQEIIDLFRNDHKDTTNCVIFKYIEIRSI